MSKIDQKVSAKMFDMIMKYLKEKKKELQWIKTGIILSNLYIENNQFILLKIMLEKLRKACTLPNGKDDPKRMKFIQKIHSMEITIAMQNKDISAINKLYKKIKNVNTDSDYVDPRTMANI